ncbi:MAG: hypothetical protein R2685_15495 [Candidatus Nitrosocosmicus sp.]|nr:hypothetical protein [Candidatus Nitrosocosmicus sp.]
MRNNIQFILSVFLIATVATSMATAAVIPMIKIAQASITPNEEFENTTTSSPGSEGGDSEFGLTDSDTAGFESEIGETTEVPTINLVDPNAYSYQVNPAKATVDITVDPNQKINSEVKDSFGSGVAGIPIEVASTDPSGKTSTSSGTTDASGKSVITVPVNTAGSWTAEVTIKSDPAVDGPHSDTISWNAIGASPPPPPPPPSMIADSKLTYSPVDLSNDPRQQIITTVKDAAGMGIKDVKLTIKLTNADGLSKTSSRITDANGVDEFVTPVDKAGSWKAVITVKDNTGKIVDTKTLTWNAINKSTPTPTPPSSGSSNFNVKVTIANDGSTRQLGTVSVKLDNSATTSKAQPFNVAGFKSTTKTFTFPSSIAPVGTPFNACANSFVDSSGGCQSGQNTPAKIPESVTIRVGS